MNLQLWLAIATVLGFLITLGGLVAAWLGARREYNDAQSRIDTLERLAAEEAVWRDSKTYPDLPDDEKGRLREQSEAAYAAHGLLRPTLGNLPRLAAYESRRLLGLVLKSTGRDFLVAAFGLLVSTAASVGSLFVVS